MAQHRSPQLQFHPIESQSHSKIGFFTMAGSSHRYSLMVFMLFVSMTRLVITAKAAAENHTPASPPFDSSTIPHDDTATATKGEFISGKMSFSEEWRSDTAPSTCTCTCYPGNGKAPPKSSTPSSVRSPSERQRSPPPAPYYWPSNSPSSPVYAPTTKSPTVSFASPPPMYGDDVPSYEQPAPFVASPQTFVPSPPPPPVY